ncbi:cysteine-rich VLP protein [uncultured Ruminococcus sp.]|uniref:cysteine-rich VLP protein n=1 Tax=uncultured Ruminococcus sp. TaxID=165186 RepID=UPI0026658279|nr:cysteine-rich VLP protein [uncultured Ruminococcus sp.]
MLQLYGRNCLLLDNGETHTCVQLISKYHIFCNHFKDAVLPLDKELYRVLICDNDYKRCQSCGSRFYSKARNKRYCDKCADIIKRQKAVERKRRQRERQKQLLYINN